MLHSPWRQCSSIGTPNWTPRRSSNAPAAFDAELLVLGSSTWGVGDLQDDWAAQLDGVKANFAGKKVATFGLGDSVGFADSFCVAAETLATAAKDAGATLVGEVLKLDDTNEADQTDSKIAAWVETLKA